MSDEEWLKAINTAVERAVDHQMAARSRLLKNGESWPAFFGRTWERWLFLIVSVLLAVFNLGGTATRLLATSAQALSTAQATASVNERLTGELEAMRRIVDAQAQSIAVGEKGHATKADIAAIDDRIRTLATRQELRRVLNEEVLPRLSRIEDRR